MSCSSEFTAGLAGAAASTGAAAYQPKHTAFASQFTSKCTKTESLASQSMARLMSRFRRK